MQELLTQEKMCSRVNKPQRVDEVKLASEEITHLDYNCCYGPGRTVAH